MRTQQKKEKQIPCFSQHLALNFYEYANSLENHSINILGNGEWMNKKKTMSHQNHSFHMFKTETEIETFFSGDLTEKWKILMGSGAFSTTMGPTGSDRQHERKKEK